MRFSTAIAATTGLVTAALSAAFSATGNNNVVLYWGQASAGSQDSLATYCQSTDADMYVLSFLSDFPTSGLSIIGCSGTLGISCTTIAEDIKTCQSLGKKVLLSLGGAIGSYGFTSDTEAETYAATLWNSFGGGTSENRPFGDVVLDGFDFDIENGDQTGYAALATTLRTYFNGGSYYLSATPQCVYPDASLSNALANAYFDFIFIQFYNNYCQLGTNFNWATWKEYVVSSPNPSAKLYLGLPGSASAASYGYASTSTVAEYVAELQSDSNFGGIMMWDASQAFSNIVDGISYAAAMKSILDTTYTGSVSSSVSKVASTTSSVAQWVWNPSTSTAAQWAATTSTSSVAEWEWNPSTSSVVEWEWNPSTSTAAEWVWNPSTSTVVQWAATTSTSSVAEWEWNPSTSTSVKATSTSTAAEWEWTPSTSSVAQWAVVSESPSRSSSAAEWVWVPSTSSSVPAWEAQATTSTTVQEWAAETSTALADSAADHTSVGLGNTIVGKVVDKFAEITSKTSSLVESTSTLSDKSTSSSSSTAFISVASSTSVPTSDPLTATTSSILSTSIPVSLSSTSISVSLSSIPVSLSSTLISIDPILSTSIPVSIPSTSIAASSVVTISSAVPTVEIFSELGFTNATAVVTSAVADAENIIQSSTLISDFESALTVLDSVPTSAISVPLVTVSAKTSSFYASIYDAAQASSISFANQFASSYRGSFATVIVQPTSGSTTLTTPTTSDTPAPNSFDTYTHTITRIITSTSGVLTDAADAITGVDVTSDTLPTSSISVDTIPTSLISVVDSNPTSLISVVDSIPTSIVAQQTDLASAGSGVGSVIPAKSVTGKCAGKEGKQLSSCLNELFANNESVELYTDSTTSAQSPSSSSTTTTTTSSQTSTKTTSVSANGIITPEVVEFEAATTTVFETPAPSSSTSTRAAAAAAASSSTSSASAKSTSSIVDSDTCTEGAVTCSDGKFAMCKIGRAHV